MWLGFRAGPCSSRCSGCRSRCPPTRMAGQRRSSRGAAILMRHALAPGTGDPADFALDDCSTQRNLSDEGRAQARMIGEAFASRGIRIDEVLTSQWCRCRETGGASGSRARPGLSAAELLLPGSLHRRCADGGNSRLSRQPPGR